MHRQSFTFIDLFAGIGGFHHAMSSMGGECVMACEIDEAAQKVYKSQFLGTRMVADIRTIAQRANGSDRPLKEINKLVPDHDVLCAGFPCQPFSKSGFQKGVRDRTRGTLFFDIMEIVRAKRPKFLILENVRNLAGPRHRDTWATIIASIRAEGYIVASEPLVYSPHLLPPQLDGAPQIRDRVFILAWKNGGVAINSQPGEPLVAYEPAAFWDPHNWSVDLILDDDKAIPQLTRYQLRPEEVGWLDAWNEFIRMIKADWLPGFPIWADDLRKKPVIPDGTPDWKRNFLIKNSEFYCEHSALIDRWRKKRWGPLKQNISDFPPSRRNFEWQARRFQPKAEDRDIWKLVIHFRPSGIRVKPPTYLPALVAITQTSVIGHRRRRITPREAARLQGFPTDIFEKAGVDDTDAYKQLGNAVNIGVAKYLAKFLFDAASADSSESLATGG
jgi:DNA (cytosine-5)-methyltransferase 1